MRERRFSSALRIPATCPECAGALALRDLAAAFRCPYCAAALLSFHEGPRRAALPFKVFAADLSVRLPGATGEAEALFLPFEVAVFLVFELEGGRLRSALVERSALALAPDLDLPVDLPLPARETWAADVRPFEPIRADGALVLAEEGGTRVLDGLRAEVLGGSATRKALLLSRTILFWPFHLVPVAGGSLLVDGVTQRDPTLLTEEKAASLLEGRPAKVGADVKPVSARCPVCRAGLPLAGPFCVRVCGPCGAVVAITETGLVKLAREADTDTLPAGGAVRVPVWRFRFTLTDPSDGSSCASVSAVAARLAGAAASSEAGAVDTVDVAAHVPGAEPEASEAASREGAAFLPGKLSAEHAAEIFRLALAAQLPAGVLSTVPVERFAGLVLEGPLALETPRLVWR